MDANRILRELNVTTISSALSLSFIFYFATIFTSRGLLAKKWQPPVALLANLFGFYFCFLQEKSNADLFLPLLVVILGVYSSYLSIIVSQKIRCISYPSILLPFVLLVFFRQYQTWYFFGIAFLCIRLSYLAFEVLERKEPLPNFIQYLNYAFFLPVVIMGPITPYSSFRHDQLKFNPILSIDLLFRFIFGLVKLFVLSSIFYKLSFESFKIDFEYSSHEYVIAGFFFYLALYLKLSGICDLVITYSAALGYRINENFNNPLLSRNPQDHWRRWHVSLIEYFTNVYFVPISFYLQRAIGSQNEGKIVTALTFFIFTFISFWHGPRLEYLAFAWFHATGVLTVYFFHKWLKRMPKTSVGSFSRSKVVKIVAWTTTTFFISVSYILFAKLDILWIGISKIF